MTELQRKDALMPATYSSFDTLTIGQFDGDVGRGGPMLPVLAAIPAISGAASEATPPDAARVEHRAEAAHAEGVAPPRYQAAFAPATPAAPPIPPEPAPKPVAAPAPAVASNPEPTHAAALCDAEWEDAGWASRVLAVEGALRPHARLILLAALIAITSLLLVVLKAPTPAPVDSLPTDVVDAPALPPALTPAASERMLASDASPGGKADQLAPMPSFPSTPSDDSTSDTQASATITAAGPVDLAAARRIAKLDPITPIPLHRSAVEVQDEAPAPDAAGSPVRVAERTSYPSTSYSTSWPAPASSAPPRAVLQSPTTPYQAGSQQ